jgi:hypothetical protein
LDNFNLPTKATLFSKEENGITADRATINAIKLKALAGEEMDSKLTLLIHPDELFPIAKVIRTAIKNYKGFATPIGDAEPYLTVAQAFLDRDISNILESSHTQDMIKL